MKHYGITTIVLIIFVIATSFYRFEMAGFWVVAVVLFAAWILNQTRNLAAGIALSGLLILFGLICPGMLTPLYYANEEARCVHCVNNLKQLGLALLNYEDSHKHFPPVYTCDQDGKPLFSWNVALLPYLDDPNNEEKKFDDLLKKNEPWNSPSNAKILASKRHPSSTCPSSKYNGNMNYLPIIGPGTIWRKEGTVRPKDVANGLSHTVALVEVADSGAHWAEPFALTVEEALDRMKTGKGVRISSHHHGLAGPLYVYSPIVNVLFADGAVRTLPAKMPISLWRKILAGELKDFDHLESQIDPHAPDMVDLSVSDRPMQLELGTERRFWGLIAWLFSFLLLFYKAGKSRRKAGTC